MKINRHILKFGSVVSLLPILLIGLSLRFQPLVHAADNNFADGITVDSTGDGADANTADSICDDGSGNCTLRAAIEESNQEAGTQTIEFNITGTADFTNGGQDGYTIQPSTGLPDITDTVIIDGYSQPGAQANTAVAPNPLNGTLLIEIDGSNAGNAFGIISSADGTEIRGLVINSFERDGIGVGSDNLIVQGCYLGVDPSGSTGRGNLGFGIAQAADDSDNLLFGGLDPEDRNLVSGNEDGGLSPNTGSDNWIIQGNYFGLNALGLAAIPNAQPGGSGALSIDNSDGHIVGGSQTGAVNVISGNASMGIAPHNATNLTIQGNYIGVDYTGLTSLPNGGSGVGASGVGSGIIGGSVLAEANIIANSADSSNGGGVDLYDSVVMAVLGNSIYNNDARGIVLEGSPTNDLLDSDTGPNNLLNYPEYTNVTESGGNTTIEYHLDVPAGDYRIEFFSNTAADPSGYGEGETYLGYQNISHPGGGYAFFTYTLTGVTGVTNLAMTTTERNVATPSSFGSTSEFSANVAQNPVADLSFTKTLVNPQDVAIGATLTYQFTISNNGPETVDLADFDGTMMGANNLVVDIMPPDITFANNVSNANITCSSLGSGSAIAYGAALANHSDYELVMCPWTGGSQLLTANDSFSFTFDVTVQSDSDLVFTNYAFTSTIPSNDPDADTLGAIFTSGNDILDEIFGGNEVNNVARAQYPIPEEPETPSTNNDTTNNSLLAKTGDALVSWYGLVGLISAGLVGCLYWRSTKPVKYSART